MNTNYNQGDRVNFQGEERTVLSVSVGGIAGPHLRLSGIDAPVSTQLVRQAITMPNEITVYWDEQDSDNIGWAYRTESDSGAVEAGDLPSAIEETCRLLGVNLILEDFAREEVEGGVAYYTAPDCPGCGSQNALYAEHGHTDGPREYHAACWMQMQR